MRTTIDLPDDLLRQAKSTAALRGMKLKELFTDFIQRGLAAGSGEEVFGRPEPIPVRIPNAGRIFPPMTNAEMYDILDKEEGIQNGGSA